MHIKPTRLSPGFIRMAVATVAVAALIGTAACAAPDEDDDSSAASVSAEAGALPVTITHNLGETTIATEPKRIATLGPGDSDILLALGITPTTIVPFGDSTGENAVAPWNES